MAQAKYIAEPRFEHRPQKFVRVATPTLIYVGITAVTRHLIVYVQNAQQPDLGTIYLAAATFILAGAVFVIRYTSYHYPSQPEPGLGHDET